MSERFIKFIPSDESMYLVRKHSKAFALLTIIAERARRENGHPDGLTIGQCHVGDWESMGFTRQEYRTALNILIVKKYVEKVETCRTRKKSTTGSTTVGTLVRLCDSRIYDINLKDDNHRINHCPTTDQPRTRKKKKEEEYHPSIPSLRSGRDSALTDDFSFEKEKIEVIPNIFLSRADLDACIKLKGDIEKVKQAIEAIQDSKRRKHEITDWPNALARWKVDNKAKTRIEENIALAEKLSSQFEHFEQGKGWRCRLYLDRKTDQKGLLFESESAYKEASFIAIADGQFEKKCKKTLSENNMNSRQG